MRAFRIFILLIWISTSMKGQRDLRIAFWNVENLFDLHDNPQKKDDDFLPDSPRHWNFYKYRQKVIGISKILIALGEGQAPGLVGLCEVESDSAMQALLKLTPLYNMGYRYLMANASDHRGINIALLYRRHQFQLLAQRSIRVNLGKEHHGTRDLLHITGRISASDTLDLILCHLPSRRGGVARSQPARKVSYQHLRQTVDSLLSLRSAANIVIMGDLNDTPCSSIQNTNLRYNSDLQDTDLINLMTELNPKEGSHKYQGEWNYLDQIIIHRSLQHHPHFTLSPASVYTSPFLLTEDEQYFGMRPKSTYRGYQYEGGVSDHLPIYVDLKWNRK